MFRAFTRELRIIRKRPTYYMALTGVFSALAAGLMFLQFPIFPPPVSFLKLDFADVPVAILAVALGPFSAVAAALIKNGIHLAASDSAFVGEFSNFVLSAAFALTVALIFNIRRDTVMLMVSLAVGIVVTIAVAMLTNYYIMVPMYMKILGLDDPLYDMLRSNRYLYLFALPFNAIKFAAQSVVAALLYKALQRTSVLKRLDRDGEKAVDLPAKPAAAARQG